MFDTVTHHDPSAECPECRKDIVVHVDLDGNDRPREYAPGAFRCMDCGKWHHLSCSESDDVCDHCWYEGGGKAAWEAWTQEIADRAVLMSVAGGL